MKNKEIEELLNKLKKCRDYDDEVLLIKQYGATLILSYIEQLETNRDKAIEYVEEKGRLKYNPNELINILKGDSDE